MITCIFLKSYNCLTTSGCRCYCPGIVCVALTVHSLGNAHSYGKLVGITDADAIIIPSIPKRHLLNLTGKSNNIHIFSCSHADDLLWLFSETSMNTVTAWTRRLDVFWVACPLLGTHSRCYTLAQESVTVLVIIRLSIS